MVYFHTHVDADQDILAPAVRLEITAYQIPAEMEAHAGMVLSHTDAPAHQDILELVVSAGITALLIPAEMVARA